MPRRSFPRSTTPTTLTAASNQMTMRSRVMMKLSSFLIDKVGLVAACDFVLRRRLFQIGETPIQAEGKSVRRYHWIKQERPHEISDLLISLLKGL
jgi:hypothetical protein